MYNVFVQMSPKMNVKLVSEVSSRAGFGLTVCMCMLVCVYMRVEGNGNPLQCSCLEKPRDGRAWWAAVYGVAQSRTRLKRRSSSSSSSDEECEMPVRKMVRGMDLTHSLLRTQN